MKGPILVNCLSSFLFLEFFDIHQLFCWIVCVSIYRCAFRHLVVFYPPFLYCDDEHGSWSTTRERKTSYIFLQVKLACTWEVCLYVWGMSVHRAPSPYTHHMSIHPHISVSPYACIPHMSVASKSTYPNMSIHAPHTSVHLPWVCLLPKSICPQVSMFPYVHMLPVHLYTNPCICTPPVSMFPCNLGDMWGVHLSVCIGLSYSWSASLLVTCSVLNYF